MSTKTLVPDIRTIKRMAEAGFVVLDPQTGKKVGHWSGATVTAYYVGDAGPKLKHWSEVFEFEGERFRLRYFSGCFKPFVCREDWDGKLPSFV